MDIHSPEFLQDPYPIYEQRRRQSPIIKVNDFTWTVTGHDEMLRILSHPSTGRGNTGVTPKPDGDKATLERLKKTNPALKILDDWMVVKNPPEHTTIRNSVAKVFTLKMVEQFEVATRDAMREFIANIKSKQLNQEFDLVSEVAYPLPIRVICQMLGIPKGDRAQFARWTNDFSIAIQVNFETANEPLRQRLNQSAVELKEYFSKLIPQKKREENDDLMTRMIKADGASMSEHQILANCVFLLFAGQETTTCSIANAINVLLKNPDQLSLLRADPSLIDNAIEECLRYDPPVQMVGRFALGDIEFDDIHIKQGDHMYIFLGAAGWDPAANPEPARFDIKRKKIKHLAFVRGTHHCLGIALARLELKVAIEELLNAFPNLQLTGPGVRNPTWLMRGFQSLPVRDIIA